jgi:putative hydrolase
VQFADVNAVVGGYLRDLAFAQSSPQKQFGYKRAANAILSLDTALTDLVGPDGVLPRIPGIGPASTRVIREILATGGSPTVEHAIEQSDRRDDIQRRRRLREHFLSRAAVRRILADPALAGPSPNQYRGDLQMHSEWSDGSMSLGELVEACASRGYEYSAVTDHSYGLPIARGMSMTDVARQHREIERVNSLGGKCHLFKGVEANITATGALDLSPEEASGFDVVLAAPHSQLRPLDDQTARLVRALEHPRTHILAHPRGRMAGSRAGIVADWDEIFGRAAEASVAVELDGDPARQDLDYELARRALKAGCIFAVDSDAHSADELAYAETALAHARLANIPRDRIVNCWNLDRFRNWLADRAMRPR